VLYRVMAGAIRRSSSAKLRITLTWFGPAPAGLY
jgi:hypothetical protein